MRTGAPSFVTVLLWSRGNVDIPPLHRHPSSEASGAKDTGREGEGREAQVGGQSGRTMSEGEKAVNKKKKRQHEKPPKKEKKTGKKKKKEIIHTS